MRKTQRQSSDVFSRYMKRMVVKFLGINRRSLPMVLQRIDRHPFLRVVAQRVGRELDMLWKLIATLRRDGIELAVQFLLRRGRIVVMRADPDHIWKLDPHGLGRLYHFVSGLFL